MALRFEWDPKKAESNLKKHCISFQDAATVFGDALSWTFLDPDHSAEEDRRITIGLSDSGRLLTVAHAGQQERIRIISARETTRRERQFYEEGQ